jgi:hypothetical protein
MRKNPLLSVLKSTFIAVSVFFSCSLFAQQSSTLTQNSSVFWRNVQFGGGIGLGFGSGYTDISLAPSAIYNFNEYVALGLGVQYTYAKQKNFYTSNLYGTSIIGLFSPIKEIQLSAELEQLRVNVKMNAYNGISRDYWNTGLFLGAGYRTGNVTIGGRYNVLDDNTNIYGSAFMPFVRVYF